jgi:hypothetical protein
MRAGLVRTLEAQQPSEELIHAASRYIWGALGIAAGPAAVHPVSVALVFRGRGLSLMFNNCEKLRLVNRHVAEIRQRLEAQEARAAELERNGGAIEDATTLLDEARWTLRLMERHRDVILWDHARGS